MSNVDWWVSIKVLLTVFAGIIGGAVILVLSLGIPISILLLTLNYIGWI